MAKIEDSSAWFHKSSQLTTLGRYQEDIVCFDKAIKLDTEPSFVWNEKGNLLKKLGRDEEAEQCFTKAKE